MPLMVNILISYERARILEVVWLSDKAYKVDALAIRGEEGRANLRKAWMSR